MHEFQPHLPAGTDFFFDVPMVKVPLQLQLVCCRWPEGEPCNLLTQERRWKKTGLATLQLDAVTIQTDTWEISILEFTRPSNTC